MTLVWVIVPRESHRGVTVRRPFLRPIGRLPILPVVRCAALDRVLRRRSLHSSLSPWLPKIRGDAFQL